jgi:hypothetical protein
MNIILISLISMVIFLLGNSIWIPFGIIKHEIDTGNVDLTTCTYSIYAKYGYPLQCDLYFNIYDPTINETNVYSSGTTCDPNLNNNQHVACYVIYDNTHGFYAFLNKSNALCHSYSWFNGCMVIPLLASFATIFSILGLIFSITVCYHLIQENKKNLYDKGEIDSLINEDNENNQNN